MNKPELQRIHIELYPEDVSLAKARGIAISLLLRRMLHEYLMAPEAEFDLEQQRKILKEKELVAAELQAEVQRQRVAVRNLELAFEAKQKVFENQKKAYADRMNRCVVCGDLLYEKTMKVIDGPHKGLFICGSYATGCSSLVVCDPDRSWWVLPSRKEKITEEVV